MSYKIKATMKSNIEVMRYLERARKDMKLRQAEYERAEEKYKSDTAGGVAISYDRCAKIRELNNSAINYENIIERLRVVQSHLSCELLDDDLNQKEEDSNV